MGRAESHMTNEVSHWFFFFFWSLQVKQAEIYIDMKMLHGKLYLIKTSRLILYMFECFAPNHRDREI